MSDELFLIHQQFYTGQFDEVASTSLEEYDETVIDEVRYYIIRSLLNLGKYQEASDFLSNHPSEYVEFNDVTQQYIKFSQSYEEESEFDSIVEKNSNDRYTQIFGGLYFVKLGKFEEAIQILQRHQGNLEAVLILVEIYLYLNKVDLAQKEVTKASEYSNDSIIYNYAESLVNSVKNTGSNLRSSLYFFEEISHSAPTFKTLGGQFVLNLQLHQFPEAEVVLKQLQELEGTDANFLANQITYSSLVGDSKLAEEKRAELEKLDQDHPVITDYKAKNELFDSIVEKYSTKVIN